MPKIYTKTGDAGETGLWGGRRLPKHHPRVRAYGEIDRMTGELKPMKHFILPGGAPAGAWLHLARAVCRRAEREVVGLRAQDGVPDSMLVYINRLSDFLFTAARWANSKLKSRETEWRGLGGR